MKKYVLTIDLGTSGCKVIAVDNEGHLLASVTEPYPISQPKPGWSEQNPSDWWTSSVKAIKQVLGQLASDNLVAIGLSGQMHGMVALDSVGEVVRPAILWNDQRTQNQCDQITKIAGGLNGLLTYTNNMMLTGYTGGKILWLKEEEPENYDRTVKVINPKDYIGFKLSGNISTEVSDASGTGFFDVKNRLWSYELIEKVGINKDIFPTCLESTDEMGKVNQTSSDLTGIPKGTPVFAGGGDAVISTTGMGLIAEGRIGVSLGTSGVVAAGLPDYADNKGGLLQLFCNNAPSRWMAFGCTLAAAGSLQWFRDSMAKEKSYRELDNLAESVSAGADGLLFLPYLTGERCPLFDPKAKGAFVGITSAMETGHFSRAVLEGVAFSLKQVYNLIESSAPNVKGSHVVVSGGGAVSPLWRQIIADIFEMPVLTVYGSAEGSAFGAALIAGVGCGFWKDINQAMEIPKKDKETLPNSSNFQTYREMYDKYCKMYDSLKWSFN